MADYITEVQKLYVAYFSRPGDPNGVAYWASELAKSPAAYQAISASFAGSAEYRATYGGMNNDAVVNKVYQHLFGRNAEQSGLDYWSDLLDQGKMTIDNVVTNIAQGAQGSDLFAYNAKVAVSAAFTERLDLPGEVQAYSTMEAVKIAFDFIATVKDIQTAAAARDPGRIDTVISTIVSAHGSGLGEAGIVGVPEVPPPVV